MCKNKGVLVALGTFDGLHEGHRQVLLSDKTEYGEKIALMFSRHPQSVLSGETPGELITNQKKIALLKEWGYRAELVDFKEISGLSPREFFENVIIKTFGATAICCGFNYRFGKGGEGNVSLLESLCREKGLKLTVCEPVLYNGEAISSTRIRQSLREGDIKTANAMLGRLFSYSFEVVHGDKRGRILGSPTINQFFSPDFTVPQFGVYASVTEVEGKKYISVTNIGIRPTIGSSEKRSETYILGFEGDLYGKFIEVSLVEKIRGEKQFASLEELSKQISEDREKALSIIEKEGLSNV